MLFVNLCSVAAAVRPARLRALKWVVSAFFIGALIVAGATTTQARAIPIVGMNLAGADSPLRSSWDFADLMKTSNNWNTGDLANTTFDANDWPTFIRPGQSIGTNVRLPVGNRAPHYPLGQYTMTWEGLGTFNLSGAGDNQFVSATNPAGGTRAYNATTQGQQIFLRINTVDTTNPLRNIRILMPGYAPGQALSGQTFNTTFAQTIRPFSTLRFMDWGSTNVNTNETWSQRQQVSARTYGGNSNKGVPIEHKIALANQQDADPWFNMPVRANDDYVRKQALLARDTLEPGRKVYVEYGNEVWNAQFTVERGYVEQLAQQRYGDKNLWYRTWAEEARRDFAIWKEVFNETGQADRVVRVAAAQATNRFHTPRFLNNLYENPSDTNPTGARLFDIVSMGAYVGANTAAYNASTTKDKILDDLFSTLAFHMNPTIGTDGRPVGDFRWQKSLADSYGVPLIAYEGGQSIVPGSATSPWYNAYVQAQRDPRMYGLYRALLRQYLDVNGAAGFINFSSVASIGESGAWGALEFADQSIAEAHKYRALIDYVASIPEPAALSLLALAIVPLQRRRKSFR